MLSWKFLLRVLFFSIIILQNSFTQSWFIQPSGVTSHLLSVYFADANTGWCGTITGSVLKTTNSGVSWAEYSTGQSIGINSLYFISSTAGFACGDLGYILSTVNGGVNWSALVSSTSSSLFKIRFINSSTGWAAGDFRTIVKTTNSGVTWATQITGSNSNYSVFPLTSSIVFSCGYDGVIYKSTNGGINWYVPNSNTSYILNDIYFSSATTGVAVGYGTPIPTVLRTTNSGENWSIVPTASGSGLNALHFPTSSSGWACGYDGIIMNTTNSGANWTYQSTPVPTLILKDINFINSSTGWCVGYLGTILKTTNGGITAVQQTGTEIPQTFLLSQNFPNPFNPVTSINFNIPSLSITKLIVFDQLGMEVETLVNEQLSPGSYKYEWNAADYPSGVYFYKLQAGEFVETKKMVLMK